MKITLLGTGSPTPMLNRAGSGYLIEVGDEMIVFDHGAGAHHSFLQAGKRAVDLNTIFFSHLHADHCLDYARLVHSRWDQGAGLIPELKVYGPSHIARMTDLLFDEDGVFGPDISGRIHAQGSQRVYVNRGGKLPRQRPQPDVTILYDGKIIETDNWKITIREVNHQPGYIEAYGFRLETDAGVLAYSGDTGPCEGIDALAKDADILIHMCYFVSGTFLPPSQVLTASGHLEIADLAARQNVKTLVATHFTPQMEPPGIREKCIAEMAQIYSGTIIWGADLMEITLGEQDIGQVV